MKIELNKRNVPFRNEKQYIFIGQSAAGKDWMAQKLMEDWRYPKLISHTTRPPRPGEEDGVDYFFVDSFDPEKDDWVEYRKYHTIENGKETTWYYWLTPEQVMQEEYVGILDYEGAIELTKWTYNNIGRRPSFVYVWASPQTLRERAEKRPGFEEAEFERRLETDLKWEPEAMSFADMIVYNDSDERYEEHMGHDRNLED